MIGHDHSLTRDKVIFTLFRLIPAVEMLTVCWEPP